MAKGLEETPGRHSCEVLKLFHHHHLAIADGDAPSEDIETNFCERGIKVGEVGDREEVVES